MPRLKAAEATTNMLLWVARAAATPSSRLNVEKYASLAPNTTAQPADAFVWGIVPCWVQAFLRPRLSGNRENRETNCVYFPDT